ncbi:MAG TPA: metallopeptidase TldD-related protein [Candidatus Lustribacter sp.]
MNAQEREALARRALERSRADQTEVSVTASDQALTRFTHGISNQNVASHDVTISVRAIVGNRTGVASSNDPRETSVDALVERAAALAELAPPDPLVPVLPAGAPVTEPRGCYDARTAGAEPSQRAARCKTAVDLAVAAGYWSAGYVSTAAQGLTVANSSGALASFDGTDAAINVKVTAADSTGYAEQYAAAIGDVDAAAAGARAVGKARGTAAPRSVDPGEWTVILEPAAIGELLAYLVSHFSAQNFSDGSSFFSGALDQSYFDERFSLYDDYAHPLAPSMPFDFEGQPKTRVPLVEHGIVRGIVTDSYYAKKLERPNTGHALPAPNAYGPQALNVVVAPGSRSTAELIASTARGLLISRFWYIRTVDQKRAIVTGMTRDGTFLIENGTIAGGVRNLRFNQSIVEALRGVECASDLVRTGQYSYSLVVPTVKIDRFSFTSTTEF